MSTMPNRMETEHSDNRPVTLDATINNMSKFYNREIFLYH